jgi:hypothetical protein
MSQDAALRCRCGEVRARVSNASPGTVNRLLCYCDDCQAYLHHLGRTDLMNAQGGTDIIQVAPASLRIERGAERVVGLRLTPKGLYRWYASCCKTPVGNTLGPAVPFVGVVAAAFERPDLVGAPRGAILGRYAVGPPPEGSTKLNPRLLAHVMRLIVGWKLTGETWPHPFFDRATRAPTPPLTTLSCAERESIRPLCGPRAAASS